MRRYSKLEQKIRLQLKDDQIKLGQALKAAGLVSSGVDAKYAVQDGQVKVNGVTELQRGKKLTDGDVIEFQGKQVFVCGGQNGHPVS
ncbi:MAG: RNA-binding S4 domain-containing protein [Lachnospiraceae bacterium]|nr:RNA-binding S4 domain-containing protein [Lachnospiraceae bacterium]